MICGSYASTALARMKDWNGENGLGRNLEFRLPSFVAST